MPVDLSLAWRLGRGQPWRVWLLVACVAIGVAARVGVGTLLDRLETAVAFRARGLLAADVEISNIRPLREARATQLPELLPPGSRIMRQETLTTMAARGERSRPVHLQAVEPGYPFFGQLVVEGRGRVTVGEDALRDGEAACLVHPELLVQLDAEVGETIRIGRVELTIQGLLEDEPGLGAGFLGIGPKVLLRREDLRRSRLAEYGSRVRHATLLALPRPEDATRVVDRLKAAWALGEVSVDPMAGGWGPVQEIRLRTTRDAERQVRRLFDRFGDYLRLVSLAALLLGGLGVASVVRVFVQENLESAAVLQVLGATPTRVLRITWLQVLGICLAGALAGLALGTVGVDLLLVLAADQLPFAVTPGVAPDALLWGLALGLLTAGYFVLPPLLEARDLTPLQVLRDERAARLSGRSRALLLLSGVLLLIVLACLETRSLRRGLWFSGALLLGAAALRWTGVRALALLERLGHDSRLPYPVRLGLSNLGRPGLRPESGVLTLGLTAMIFSIVVLVKGTLLTELSPALGGETASLFLIDIQEDQIDGIRSLLEGRGLRDYYASPMIKARLKAINGRELGRETGGTREAQRSRRFQRREQNLSYRVEPGPDDTLVRGSWMRAVDGDDSPIEASLELRFSERIGASMGDRLTFDILGVEIEARVTSIRRVRWSSARPNHFILLSPHALRDAPKVWIASVPPLPTKQKSDLQEELVRRFPNVTAFDVHRQLSRVRGVLRGLFAAVQLMGLSCLAAGLLVLAGIGLSTGHQRRRDAALLKVLGARTASLRAGVLVEFGGLGIAAALLGAGVALPLAAAFADRVMRLPLAIPVGELTLVAVTLVALAALTGWVACRDVARVRPLVVLREA